MDGVTDAVPVIVDEGEPPNVILAVLDGVTVGVTLGVTLGVTVGVLVLVAVLLGDPVLDGVGERVLLGDPVLDGVGEGVLLEELVADVTEVTEYDSNELPLRVIDIHELLVIAGECVILFVLEVVMQLEHDTLGLPVIKLEGAEVNEPELLPQSVNE